MYRLVCRELLDRWKEESEVNRRVLPALLHCGFLIGSGCVNESQHSSGSRAAGSRQKPLRVMLVPADGGTEEETKADFEPIFRAVTETSGLHFLKEHWMCRV